MQASLTWRLSHDHSFLEKLLEAVKLSLSRAQNYQQARETYAPGNAARSQAYRLWRESDNEVNRLFVMWRTALHLETEDRGNKK